MVKPNPDNKKQPEIVGLIPAGGQATRLAPLPCSKELFPIGFRRVDEDGSLRPKVACHYLLEKIRLAGATKSFIVLRNGKWDIPSYFGNGKMLDMRLAYLIMDLPFGVPYTIDQAYPFIQDAIVAFGFPDIIFEPEDAFIQLLNRQVESNADIVLGLFPVDQPQKWDMVDLGGNKQIRNIVIRPNATDLKYTWIIALWSPVFTHFMHEYIVNMLQSDSQSNILKKRELYLGDVIQAAIGNGLKTDCILFPDNTCLDIGTPDELAQAICQNPFPTI